MKPLLAFCIGILATSAAAQSLPDRFMVSGVAANDVLNIRAEPNRNAEIIGEFGPYTLNVETLEAREGWARVPTPEGWGWVSLAYLTPNPVPEDEASRPLQCSGTEPFWTVSMYPRGSEINELADERGPRPLILLNELIASNGYVIGFTENDGRTHQLIIDGRLCNDGMSDRPFRMTGTMVTTTQEGSYFQTGCCTMQVN